MMLSPCYLKLSTIKGIVAEAEKHLGSPLIYLCVEWLQENVDMLIENPPKLRDVTEKMMTLTVAHRHQRQVASHPHDGGPAGPKARMNS